MKSEENLEEQLRDILLVNNGDLNVNDYPYIIKEAEESGITLTELARKIRKVNQTIDWRPYNQIDKLLEQHILKGSISEKEAETIIKNAEKELQRPKVVSFILATIKKRGFMPREKNSFEYDSFKNRWMTEDAWIKYQKEKVEVEWLGETAHSLEALGDISFRKPDDAKYYLRNTNYLVPIITTLTKSSTEANEFSKIIESEQNADRRYLKVLYLLNPGLPFRLLNQDFANIDEMFDKTATDFALFTTASESYRNGHIHIWLNETDPANTNKLTEGHDYNDFLQFVYKINSHHPFYLNSIKFETPEQLLDRATTDSAVWYPIAEATVDKQLLVWLSGIGITGWLDLYNEHLEKINSTSFYSAEEKKLAIVQFLIHILDPKIPDPKITVDHEKIQLLSIEGSKPVHHAINLKLENTGFTKAGVYFDNNIAGITLGNSSFAFWSQNHIIEHTLTVSIDVLQLVKNKIYEANIIVNTEYQNLIIPLQVKVVFAKKAYLIQLLKYAAFGCLFFAGVRYVTGFLAEEDSWFSFPENYDPSYLPHDYFSYFAGLLLLLGGLISAIFLIKKFEKI